MMPEIYLLVPAQNGYQKVSVLFSAFPDGDIHCGLKIQDIPLGPKLAQACRAILGNKPFGGSLVQLPAFRLLITVHFGYNIQI